MMRLDDNLIRLIQGLVKSMCLKSKRLGVALRVTAVDAPQLQTVIGC